ncbi:MAG: hypothetical protein FWH20_03120 [Oscillospiraceae bacterium]|nr:hypothetical protein [Oscillospiraceae bacterium]
MVADYYGLKFNNADNANKYAGSAAFSKMQGKGDDAALEDFKRVGSVNQKENNYDLDGILKEDKSKAARKEVLEKILGGDSTKNKGMQLYAPQSKAAQKLEMPTGHAVDERGKHKDDCPLCECETCKNRRYQDQSNDSAVSLQQATKLNPKEAAHKVRAHEMEHIRREQYQANSDGNRVITQSVRIKSAICPECGENYVSGGEAISHIRYSDAEYTRLFSVGAEDMLRKGKDFSATA